MCYNCSEGRRPIRVCALVSDLALAVSPVWLLILVLGGVYTLAIVGLFGIGPCRFHMLLGAGIAGVIVGQVASDMAGWRLLLLGDLHILQATFVAMGLLLLTRLTTRRQSVRR